MATPTTGGTQQRQRDIAVKLKVPECVGVRLDKALTILDNAGFLQPQVRYREDYAREDTVIEQYPAPGQLVNRNIGVQLVASKKSYIRYLPAIFQKSQYLDTDFLREFLWIFQHVVDGIEKRLDDLNMLFRPLETGSDFLPWLAGWVALVLDDGWPETKKRRLLHDIVQLYKVRGTVRGLKLFVKIFTDAEPRILENEYPLRGFRIAETSRIGVDVIIPPVKLAHCFIVEMPEHYRDTSADRVLKIHDIIRAERPAHSQYYLRFLAEPVAKELREFIQVGIRSGVGVGAEITEPLPEGMRYDTRLDHERVGERDSYGVDAAPRPDGEDGAGGPATPAAAPAPVAALEDEADETDDEGGDDEGSGGGAVRSSARRKPKTDKKATAKAETETKDEPKKKK